MRTGRTFEAKSIQGFLPARGVVWSRCARPATTGLACNLGFRPVSGQRTALGTRAEAGVGEGEALVAAESLGEPEHGEETTTQ
jgi:hypothetical protein